VEEVFMLWIVMRSSAVMEADKRAKILEGAISANIYYFNSYIIKKYYFY